MNIKRVFGGLLTLMGIMALIYAAFLFANTGGGVRDVKYIGIFGVLGSVFFIAGIGLVRTVRDEPA